MYPDFFQAGTLKKIGFHTYKLDKNQARTLKKNLGIFFREILQGTLQITSQGAD